MKTKAGADCEENDKPKPHTCFFGVIPAGNLCLHLTNRKSSQQRRNLLAIATASWIRVFGMVDTHACAFDRRTRTGFQEKMWP